jgi:hypothetical protein
MSLKIQPDPNLKENLMAFGFECEEGWHPLIIRCIKCLSLVAKECNIDSELLQVKEKYATLRIYISSGNSEMYNIIDAYEKLSEITCEHCGNDDYKNVFEYVKQGWVKTLCKKCARKLKYKKIIKTMDL